MDRALFTGGPDIRVRFEHDAADPIRFEARGGEVRIESSGSSRKPVDLELRSATLEWFQVLSGTGGHRAAKELQARSGEDTWAPIPPFDCATGVSVVPVVPGASAVVQHEVIHSPVGDFEFFDRFENGSLAARQGGQAPREALVVVRMGFAARVVPPGTPLMEQIEGAELRGRDEAALLLVAGLYDRPQLARLIRDARHTTNRQLAKFAAHVNSEGFRALAREALATSGT